MTTSDHRDVCDLHSGQDTWLKGIAGLLTLASGLLCYSINLQIDTMKDISKIQGGVAVIEQRVNTVEKKVDEIDQRVVKLEGRE